jgi:hypothetical protein
MIKTKFQKTIWVSQKAEFDANFKSVEKVAKSSCEKSYQLKSDRKMDCFTFITVFKSYPPITFCTFFDGFELNIDTHIEFSKQFFCTFC